MAEHNPVTCVDESHGSRGGWLNLLADCPDCGKGQIHPYGAKWRCRYCGFVVPCCETDGPAR